MYEILINNALSEDDTYDNARDTARAYKSISDLFGAEVVKVLHDGVQITAAQLAADADLQTCIDEQTTLPSTYQHGFVGGDSDVALGADGYRHAVEKTPGGEDNWD